MAGQPGKGKSCLLQITVLLAIFFVYSGVRYLLDHNVYTKAHAAYLQADCTTALPLYEKILTAFRVVDLGNYAARAGQERAECRPFQSAVDQPPAAGLVAFAHFIEDQPDSGLVPAAQGQIAAIMSHTDPSVLAEPSACAELPEIVQRAGLPPQDPSLPPVYAVCADRFTREAAYQSAYQLYYTILADQPDHPSAAQAADALSRNPYACGLAVELNEDPVIAGRAGYLPIFYTSCGQTFEERGDYREAVRVYDLFLAGFPTHAGSADVQAALARVLIAEARQSGAGEIALPEKVAGSGGATTTILIQNDSPEKVRLVFSGPETVIEELAACPDCEKYYGSGPQYCPEKGPIGSYELPSGSYEVLVESIHDKGVTPFTGSWDMEGGEYFSCFFIVEKLSN